MTSRLGIAVGCVQDHYSDAFIPQLLRPDAILDDDRVTDDEVELMSSEQVWREDQIEDAVRFFPKGPRRRGRLAVAGVPVPLSLFSLIFSVPSPVPNMRFMLLVKLGPGPKPRVILHTNKMHLRLLPVPSGLRREGFVGLLLSPWQWTLVSAVGQIQLFWVV